MPLPNPIGNELFSTEIDLDEVKPLIQNLAKDLGFELPGTIKNPKFLASADPNHWMTAYAEMRGEGAVSLWFRLEDIDTVEIVVLKETTMARRIN